MIAVLAPSAARGSVEASSSSSDTHLRYHCHHHDCDLGCDHGHHQMSTSSLQNHAIAHNSHLHHQQLHQQQSSASSSSESDSELESGSSSKLCCDEFTPAALLPHPHVHYQPTSTSSLPVTPALTGRAHQRYQDGHRLICGAVPFALAADGSVQFLCIRTLGVTSDDWIFPKGGWEDFESRTECAHRECLEESGCDGVLVADLGQCTVNSSKGKRGKLSMYLMQVTHEFEDWSDAKTRERQWKSVAEAARVITRTEMREMMNRAVAAIDQLRSHESQRSPSPSVSCSVHTTNGATLGGNVNVS